MDFNKFDTKYLVLAPRVSYMVATGQGFPVLFPELEPVFFSEKRAF